MKVKQNDCKTFFIIRTTEGFSAVKGGVALCSTPIIWVCALRAVYGGRDEALREVALGATTVSR